MDFEEGTEKEKTPGGKSPSLGNMTLSQAIDLGEYDPAFLATFAQWHTLSRHVQFQHIRQALKNRNQHLIQQWAEIVNMLDFSKKPELAEALKNIEKQLKELDRDKERLYLEFSK